VAEDDFCSHSTMYMQVIVSNWRRGLYWSYKPEAEHLLNQYRLTAPVNKYFLDHAVM